MNPNTMTLDECIKWLRDRLYVTCKCDADCGEAWFRRSDGGYVCNGTHDPIPPTLDALDRARPEGCAFNIYFSPGRGWGAKLWRGAPVVREVFEVEFTPDRLTCEARLVVSMWICDGEGRAT